MTTTESSVGAITQAYSIGIQSGPVRLDITNVRVAVPALGEVTLFARPTRYKEWRAGVPSARAFELVNGPYSPPPGQTIMESPYEEIGLVRVSRNRGLFTDETVTQLLLDHMRQGFVLSPGWRSRPGIPARTEEAEPPLLLRVPRAVEELAAFLRQTPLAPVVRGP